MSDTKQNPLDTKLDRFYVRKIGAMTVIIDRETNTVYQTSRKDSTELCALLNSMNQVGL